MKRRQVWVSDDFKKHIKIEAARHGMTVLEYTDVLAKGERQDPKKKTIQFRFF